MEREFFQFVWRYKWSIVGFVIMFTVSVLIMFVGFWPTVVIVIASLIGLVVGYVKDTNVDMTQILRNLK